MTARQGRSPRYAVIFACCGLLLVAQGVAVSATLQPGDRQAVRRARYVMGTIFEITAYGADREKTVSAVEQSFAAIRQADETLSHYRRESDLMRPQQKRVPGNRYGRPRPVSSAGESVAVRTPLRGCFRCDRGTTGQAVVGSRRTKSRAERAGDHRGSPASGIGHGGTASRTAGAVCAKGPADHPRRNRQGMGRGPGSGRFETSRRPPCFRQCGYEHDLCFGG